LTNCIWYGIIRYKEREVIKMYCGRCRYFNDERTEKQEITVVDGYVIIKTGQKCTNCEELLLEKEFYRLEYVDTLSREEAKKFLENT
jgi:hypothetical protein